MTSNRLYILLAAQSATTFYKAFPEEGEWGFLLNNEIVLHPDQWVWGVCEHLFIVGLCFYIYLVEVVYRGPVAVFLALQCVDTIFYALNYDDPLAGIPITFNIIKIVIFFFAIEHERRWKK